MRQYSDDDIEVLGGDPLPGRRRILIRRYIVMGIVAVMAMIVAACFLGRHSDNAEGEVSESNAVGVVSAEVAVPGVPAKSLPAEFTDSINDVVFTAVSLEGCRASVTFEKPDSADRNILVAVSAADIRADNGEIVGEFIHDRQQISRGIRKKGFCYISPQGSVTIGIGDGESQKKSAFDEGGTFFRQYPLVMEGEIQPNILKGKSRRRALAILDGKPAVVITKNRESIYDFSQALADYGFSHAIYLPGGGLSLIKLLTDKTEMYHAPDSAGTEYLNYLIFKH